MRVLTEIEARQWCERSGSVAFGNDLRPKLTIDQPSVVNLQLPTFAREAVVFCNSLLDMNDFDGGLFWLWDHTLGSEQLNLVGWKTCELMRKAVGELRRVDDAPAHMFGAHERTELIAFMLLPMIYYWEAYFVPADSSYLLHLNEDVGHLQTKSQQQFASAAASMKQWILP